VKPYCCHDTSVRTWGHQTRRFIQRFVCCNLWFLCTCEITWSVCFFCFFQGNWSKLACLYRSYISTVCDCVHVCTDRDRPWRTIRNHYKSKRPNIP